MMTDGVVRRCRACAAIGLASVLTLVRCTDAAAPAASDLPWRMVFRGCAADGCGLVSSDLDGADRKLLFSSDEHIFSPAPSPDAKQVAYVRFPSWRLAVVTLASRLESIVSTGVPVYSVSWSPDGGQLAFTSADGELYVVQPDGAGKRRLVAGGYYSGYAPEWSPDGTQLLASTDAQRLHVLNASTGALVRELEARGEWASWSHDGKQVVFTRQAAIPRALFVINIDGTNLRTIVPNPTDSSYVTYQRPVFSPDDRYLVANAYVQGLFRLTLTGKRKMWAGGAARIEGDQVTWIAQGR